MSSSNRKLSRAEFQSADMRWGQFNEALRSRSRDDLTENEFPIGAEFLCCKTGPYSRSNQKMIRHHEINCESILIALVLDKRALDGEKCVT